MMSSNLTSSQILSVENEEAFFSENDKLSRVFFFIMKQHETFYGKTGGAN
jgi:hypothetical protein